ncbi:heterokaryon incompatibility protein-domain-containing protein [Cercophora samala]|uniref:Heterokaryon incompatibility protein-domain-containing protein n=1 Tax=Cercophora samala TaxID=330535 RepID=A0AA40D470_9PEZI|nr:heterokaryon incompatibility protein-domain-containing protein [Cercophora samala]
MTSPSLHLDLPIPPPSNTTSPYIRLLTFWDRRWTLEVAPLATTQYKALSYVWGDPKNPLPIQCNGVELRVTRNLYWALQHLSINFPSQRLWVDAICIDQNDSAPEKGEQLDLMGEIYFQAEEVLIWLTESFLPDNTHLCFQACKVYAERWRDKEFKMKLLAQLWAGADFIDQNLNGIHDATIAAALREDNPFTESIILGLLQILRHPYWSRVWVIQEMSLAFKSRILTENCTLDWDDFKILILTMEKCLPWFLRGMGPNFRALDETTRIQKDQGPRLFYGLSDLLVQFRWSCAKDGRDKVYGLLGLLHLDDHHFFMDDLPGPKGAISIAQCYTHIAFKILQQSQDLTLLVQCSSPSFIKRDKTLPSWVPDWEYDSTHLPPPRWGLTEGNHYNRIGDVRSALYKAYNASADSQCPPPMLRDGHVLILHGMLVGKVTAVCRPIELHHQFVGSLTPRGTLQLMPRSSREETITRLNNGIIWSVFSTRWGLFMIALNYFENCLRKGAAMEVLLEYADLALSDGTWPGDTTETDPLYAMFETLMKGPRGIELVDPRFTDHPNQGFIEEAIAEFHIQARSIRWNPCFRLLRLIGLCHYFPSVYHLLLGINFFNLGKIPLSLLGWMGLQAAAILLANFVLKSGIVSYLVTAVGGFFLNRKLSYVLSMPYRLDTVILTPLDHALARLADGRLALVPHDTQVGDDVSLLAGGRSPFVVKRTRCNGFKLVGDCYVDGIMEGEAWREWEINEMEFV